MLPPLNEPTLCHYAICGLLHRDPDEFHLAAIPVIPIPGEVEAVVYVQWDQDESRCYYRCWVDERWTKRMLLPEDPAPWLVPAVVQAREWEARYTPARELVTA